MIFQFDTQKLLCHFIHPIEMANSLALSVHTLKTCRIFIKFRVDVMSLETIQKLPTVVNTSERRSKLRSQIVKIEPLNATVRTEVIKHC